MRTAVIRCDSSLITGAGHVIRCRNLARQLISNGLRVVFVCKVLPGSVSHLLCQEFLVLNLKPRAPYSDLSTLSTCADRSFYSSLLCSTQKQDAFDSIDILHAHGILTWDILIVDHYSLDIEWEYLMCEYSSSKSGHRCCCVVIDDLADRKHFCDYLLDQNFYGELSPNRYHGLITPSTQLLLGPKYALLSKEYKFLHEFVPVRTQLNRVLVSFGGTDGFNLTYKALKSLTSTLSSDIAIDVVVSPSNSSYEKIVDMKKSHSNISLLQPTSSLACLMVRADLAIGGSGFTNWERSCLRLPSLIISCAPNQLEIARALNEAGHAVCIGESAQISTEQLQERMFYNVSRYDEISKVTPLTDGSGAFYLSNLIANFDLNCLK